MREINRSAGHSQYAVELLQLDTTLYPFIETSPLVISEIYQQIKGHEKYVISKAKKSANPAQGQDMGSPTCCMSIYFEFLRKNFDHCYVSQAFNQF
jgi:hypothetical protein